MHTFDDDVSVPFGCGHDSKWLDRLEARAKAEEREACAKLLDADAETLPTIYNFTGPRTDGAIRTRIKQLAMAIRAREVKP